MFIGTGRSVKKGTAIKEVTQEDWTTVTPVVAYKDLPDPTTVPDRALYLVQTTTGIIGFRKKAGVYRNEDNTWIQLADNAITSYNTKMLDGHPIEDFATKETTTLAGVLDRAYGKVSKGTDVTGKTVKDIFAQGFIGEIPAKVSLSAPSGTYEHGHVLTDVVMSIAITKGTSTVSEVRFVSNGSVVETITSPTLTNYTHTIPSIDSLTTLRAYVDDAHYTNTASNSKSLTFVYPWFTGVGVVGLTDVTGLTKHIATPFSAKTISFTTDNEVFYLAFPASDNGFISILDANAFETLGDWIKRSINVMGLDGTSQPYTVYEFKNLTTTTASYTFKR